MSGVRGFINPRARHANARGLFTGREYSDVRDYFTGRPDLRPTPLRSAARLAARSGVAAVEVKDESRRFGLSAFKILGVKYALHRLQAQRMMVRTLVCATAGNHGRAVARAAREFNTTGVPCTVFVPAAGDMTEIERQTRASRIEGMRSDDAHIVEFPGPYEEAVRAARAHARAIDGVFFSDTAPDEWDPIPHWIMAGYTWMFDECAAQWTHPPDVVFVQAGVGGLACAAASWFVHRFAGERPYLIICEPEHAACLMASAQQASGEPATISGDARTFMAGLRCVTPSRSAWPTIRDSADAFVAVPDRLVRDTMGRLRDEDPAIEAGPSGACGAASLIALADAPELAHVRSACKLDRSTRVLTIVTEGP